MAANNKNAKLEIEDEVELIQEVEKERVEVFRYKSGAVMPAKADPGSSGYDLCANISAPLDITQGELALVPTGLNVKIPPGYEIQIRPRSGLALSRGITVLNSPGTVDSSYCGVGENFEIKVILINHSKSVQSIRPGERIAQAVICKLPTDIEMVEVHETLDWSAGARKGGFGSTGTNALG